MTRVSGVRPASVWSMSVFAVSAVLRLVYQIVEPLIEWRGLFDRRWRGVLPGYGGGLLERDEGRRRERKCNDAHNLIMKVSVETRLHFRRWSGLMPKDRVSGFPT